MALLTPNDLTTSTNPSTIGVLVTPVPNVLEHLKRLFFLDFHRDPTFLKEWNKTLSERPDIAYLYHDALKIPEMKEYLKELESLPPTMTPGSFNVTLLTEGADRYSLRLISPKGYTTDPGTDDPDTFRMYSLYLLKGVVNSEGKVEGETVMFPGKDCRFHVEHWDERRRTWVVEEPLSNGYRVCSSCNILVKEGNTVVYKLITLCSISRAVHANAGEFATVMA